MLKFAILSVPLALLATTTLASAQARGSYRQSCFDISQDGPFLSAVCRRPDGSARRTSIDLRQCRTGVANTYGRLTCGGGGGGYGGGGYGGGGNRFYEPPEQRYEQPRYAPRYEQDDDGDNGYND